MMKIQPTLQELQSLTETQRKSYMIGVAVNGKSARSKRAAIESAKNVTETSNSPFYIYKNGRFVLA